MRKKILLEDTTNLLINNFHEKQTVIIIKLNYIKINYLFQY